MSLMVSAELAREGIEWAAVDWWTGRYGTHVDRFVGLTTIDLARFLRWPEDAGVSVGDASSIEGQSRNVTAGMTLIGFGRRTA
jgi:hypothetical protein